MNPAQFRSSRPFRQKQIPSSPPQGHGLGKTGLKLRSEKQFHKSYEQGELHSLEFIEQYLTHWQRYQQGIGVASSVARSAFVGTLKHVYATTPNVFICFSVN
jgi:hypothetical protein